MSEEESVEPLVEAVPPISEEDSKKLFQWNLSLGVLHLLTGIVMQKHPCILFSQIRIPKAFQKLGRP